MAKQTELPFYSKLLSLRDQLRKVGHRLVLAESCTSGLVAAEIGQIPGISEFFCGSMVVYRTPTKTAWLGIDEHLLSDPAIGPVSHQVTERLLHAVLSQTPEATIAAAITGHLGPNAPRGLDGQVYCGVLVKNIDDRATILSYRLRSPEPTDSDDLSARRLRQSEAAALLIDMILDVLSGS
ncbi:MAG: CinA family protein [Pirellula sp.]